MPQQQQTTRSGFSRPKQGLIFLVFAAVIWLLSTLSETHSAIVPLRVELKADSKNILLLSPSFVVPARMSGSGFSILYQKLVPRNIRLLTSDLPSLAIDNPVIAADFLFDKFQNQYPKSSAIKSFVVRVVELPITASTQKSFVPVLRNPPRLAEGYQLTSPLQFSVDSVSASGRKSVIDKLDAAVFELEMNTLVKGDFEINAKLKDSLSNLAQWSETTLNVSGTADRYSDVSFVLPISIIDTSEVNTITLTPKQVSIKFAAPLSKLRSLNASSLRAEVVFVPNDLGQLPVNVSGLPNTARQLVVEPKIVSYFILE